MLSAIQTIIREERDGMRSRDGESETTRFCRLLHFTPLGECRHLRDSLSLNAWDTGYEVGFDGASAPSQGYIIHMRALFSVAARFHMLARVQGEYLQGFRAGRADA
jgi:hypothetical protein